MYISTTVCILKRQADSCNYKFLKALFSLHSIDQGIGIHR